MMKYGKLFLIPSFIGDNLPGDVLEDSEAFPFFNRNEGKAGRRGVP